MLHSHGQNCITNLNSKVKKVVEADLASKMQMYRD